MTITTIVLAITVVFGGGGGGGGGGSSAPSQIDGETLKKWLSWLADALKRLAEKAVGLPALVGSVIGTILSFLAKAVGFIAEHTRAKIFFVPGLIGIWLMQKVSKQPNRRTKKVVRYYIKSQNI